MTHVHEGEAADATFAARSLHGQVHALITPETPLSVRELAIGGRDLMEEVGVPKGPALGRALEALLELVLDDPATNTRAALLAEAQRQRAGPT